MDVLYTGLLDPQAPAAGDIGLWNMCDLASAERLQEYLDHMSPHTNILLPHEQDMRLKAVLQGDDSPQLPDLAALRVLVHDNVKRLAGERGVTFTWDTVSGECKPAQRPGIGLDIKVQKARFQVRSHQLSSQVKYVYSRS